MIDASQPIVLYQEPPSWADAWLRMYGGTIVINTAKEFANTMNIGLANGSIPNSPKEGIITTLYHDPPQGSAVVNLDEMGPEAAKSFAGKQVVHAQADPQTGQEAERAKQEIDYGPRAKGYVFGAFQPATGEALTVPYDQRTTGNWIDFLTQVERWVLDSVERIYAILDNLSMHRATDVLLFCLAHPRWEFVFQPTYAAYLNLIEPWWKTLRSLALKGRRFETWEEVCDAVAKATAY